ncbi:RNA polymerase sigma factor [Nocardia pseudobrasiliensis]|uniref:RNA polymerase sigma-70 factor (ECF subfamily) n=1 Tax=Nocardia pseudobrasiliensis TaxID=45979 RepID=A0A370I508_9NOCA|nr:sigma factor [Nocardia pseudobrasiliensis]RDI65221.1 RNA polymerase sigma-70 factor (ECF subfamily) [Nocardia pseudobrasiliensis]
MLSYFVAAITSFETFDPGRGSARAWVLGIARRVYARHCEYATRARDARARLGGRRPLDVDEATELLGRIDAERSGRERLTALATLPALDRQVVELVDIAELTSSGAQPASASDAANAELARARHRCRDGAPG